MTEFERKRKTLTVLRHARFPIDDGLGLYCWFCAYVVDTRNAREDMVRPGQGRYQVHCDSCQRITRFDLLGELENELEDGGQAERSGA